MNQNEMEEWMRKKLESRPFPPAESGWEKLQAALQQPQPAPKNKRVFALPVWSRVAAAAAFLLAAGTTGYYLSQKEGTEMVMPSAVAIQKQQPALSNIQPPVASSSPILSADRADDKTPTQLPSATPVNTYQPVAKSGNAHKEFQEKAPMAPAPYTPPAPDNIAKHTEPSDNQPVLVATPQQNNITDKQPGKQPPAAPFTMSGYNQDDETIKRPMNVGVAALVGRASVGKMNYQLGVIARQKLSDKLFAEATLALAATDVTYNRQNNFNGVKTGSQNISGLTYSRTVNTEYNTNVISMGVSPVIGYKLTRNIAVSVGGAVYRNFNKSLSLKNEDNVDQAAIETSVISTSETIRQWDAGLTGGAEYKVTGKISVNAQYRYGLSTYMFLDNKAIRNSGINVGLKCLFGK